MNNVLIVSLNSGGTMGHGKIIAYLSNSLANSKKNVIIASETNFAHFFNFDEKCKKIILPKTKHVNYTLGGMYDYKQKGKILEILEEKKIDCVIFSTFFDPDLVREIKKRNIRVILISYPIRDTFRQALINNKVYSLFDKIVSLYDPSVNQRALNNEIIVNPLKAVMNIPKGKQTIDILLTCGGGGRPSSKIFINKSFSALKPILKEKENLKAFLIKGNSRTKKIVRGVESINWSKKFDEIIAFSKIIISEAGYFTMLDLINHNKSAILIPGERIIDNQELRALTIEGLGLGRVFFPFEKKQKLTQIIQESLDGLGEDRSTKFNEIKKKFSKHKEIIAAVLRELK